jgi:hypothetical protein
MFQIDQDRLSAKPRLYRYVFYLLSSFRPVALSKWSDEGEPNPFVPVTRRVKVTHRTEIQDIFEDTLGRR